MVARRARLSVWVAGWSTSKNRNPGRAKRSDRPVIAGTDDDDLVHTATEGIENLSVEKRGSVLHRLLPLASPRTKGRRPSVR